MTVDYILGKEPAGFIIDNADVNGDESIDITDVTALVDIVLGKVTLEENPHNYDFDAADVDRNGKIEITDVTALVNIVLKTTPQTEN